jgi:hypothetical protein
MRPGAIRVDPWAHMVLHTFGWSPYPDNAGYPYRWRWSRVGLAIVIPTSLAALVAWSPAWITLGAIAFALFARDLTREDRVIIRGLVV